MMKTPSTKTALLTNLILEVFRLNGRLLAAGDLLTKPLNLSSARWQVLGAITDTPLSVPQIARRMGLTRQGVQRQADILEQEKFIQYLENPDHKRAKLVSLAEKGRLAVKKLERLQIQWATTVVSGVRASEIESALQLIQTLSNRLE
jgi:DNA-binding MarR family transcriptional regulator